MDRFYFVLASLPVLTGLEMKPEYFRKHTDSCRRLLHEPLFMPELVTGKPWRIYYTWNMDYGKKCLDMAFKKATPTLIDRIKSDMEDYTEHRPNWVAATLVMIMGSARHEMLLLADQGPAGAFIGVPNVVRDSSITPNKKSVPLMKISLKLFQEHDLTYLVSMDCNVGIATLAIRTDVIPPNRTQLEEVATRLQFGIGNVACLKDEDEGLFMLV